MDTSLLLGLNLGVVWGGVVAWAIRHTEAGRAFATHMMWFVVSIGVGVDLLIALWLFSEGDYVHWGRLVALLGVSAAPLALASTREHLLPLLRALMHVYKNPRSE